VLAVRNRAGETKFWPVVENEHRGGILRMSRPLAHGSAPMLQAKAEQYATRVMTALDYVGVVAIELFVVGGELVVNEMAPRVHNSGHWTIEGSETSQFENHVRAIVGLPLGATRSIGHCAMLNAIGHLPPAEEVLAVEGAHWHSYGKAPAPGRKVGHVTVRAQSPQELDDKLARLRPIVDPHGNASNA